MTFFVFSIAKSFFAYLFLHLSVVTARKAFRIFGFVCQRWISASGKMHVTKEFIILVQGIQNVRIPLLLKLEVHYSFINCAAMRPHLFGRLQKFSTVIQLLFCLEVSVH